MALKSVLILTAAFGEGHNAAARSLAAALGEKGVAVEVHDLFAEASGPANRFVRQLYCERLAATGPLSHLSPSHRAHLS